jgi:SAM-dependent methyltransferase
MSESDTTPEASFYDKVASRFGGYHAPVTHVDEYPEANPEAIFEQKLREVSGSAKRALDIGCADGAFILARPYWFGEVIAIDVSRGMLAAARRLQEEHAGHGVRFVEADVHRMPFPENSFDVAYSRRGPMDFGETYRVLRPGGVYLEITIGENDARALKEVFGRGQNFGKWDTSVLARHISHLGEHGFDVLDGAEYGYMEYYPTRADFDTFLQGVPIFEDYDSERDRESVDAYILGHLTERGIMLERHRVVIVARKNAAKRAIRNPVGL